MNINELSRNELEILIAWYNIVQTVEEQYSEMELSTHQSEHDLYKKLENAQLALEESNHA